MRILLIDDEVKFCQALKATLADNQMVVDLAHDGHRGLDMAFNGTYDLLIVDVMLPGINGFDIVRTLREGDDGTPMLLLTARDGISDRVSGLDSGADDYLVKPFATEELLARVRALTRRRGSISVEKLCVGPFELDMNKRTIACHGVTMSLTGKEFQVMELFMRNPNQVLPKVIILDRVWGSETAADLNAVEIYIHMLRKKIASYRSHADADPSQWIKTIRGVGYLFRGNQDVS